MKKIGIITYFYNSTNYGGILQAYALCKALNSLEGVEAEQISYDYDSHIVKKKKNIKLLLKRNVKRCLSLWIKKYGVSEDEEKKIAFKYFVDRHIPHTETLYKDGEKIEKKDFIKNITNDMEENSYSYHGIITEISSNNIVFENAAPLKT